MGASPPEHLVRAVWARLAKVLLGLAMTVLFANPVQAAITFTINTGNTTGNSQKLLIDSNNCAASGPHASYVGGIIRNTGATTVDNITATMSGLTGDIYFAGGQAASQSLGALGPGETIGVYWFVGYNCVEAATAAPTIAISSSLGNQSSTANLTIYKSISANAGGLVSSTLLGPGAVVGQTIDYDVTYSFGGASSGDEYFLQPAGNQSFNASCFRLVSSSITSSIVTAIPNGSANQLYFVAATNQGGTNKTVSIRYRFQYLCANQSTTSDAYAAQTSGNTNIKYTGNYGTTTISYPPGTNPFTITKTVSPTSRLFGATASPLTYTVTITNPSAYATYIDRIDDTLPSGVSFAGISSTSNVTAALSSSVPSSGATGTISFRAKPGVSYALAANSSISLVYTANAPTAVGSYTNTAQAFIGQANTPTASATFSIANAIVAADDNAGSVSGGTGGSNLINVLANDTLGGVTATTSTVTISVTSPASHAGVTLSTSTGMVSVAAGTPAGSYSIGYQICQTAASANCATATASVTVTAPSITAANDSATNINGLAGAGAVLNLYTGDTLNSIAATSATATVAVASGSSIPAGITLDTATGNVGVSAGTLAGTYSFNYTICEKANPTNCATASATVTVAPSVELAITKTNGVTTVSRGATVTYTVTVTNSGPDAAVGALVTDSVGTGLTCTSTNPVTISGSGVPAGSFTIANLTGAGIALGTLASGQTATLSYSCQVN